MAAARGVRERWEPTPAARVVGRITDCGCGAGRTLPACFPACLPAGSSPVVPLLNNVRKSWNTRAAPRSRTAGRGAGEPGVQVQM